MSAPSAVASAAAPTAASSSAGAGARRTAEAAASPSAGATGPSADGSSGAITDATLAASAQDLGGGGLPPWLIPALLLLATSTIAVLGAVVGPRLRSPGDHPA